MPHLVGPITVACSIQEAIQLLEDAHQCITEAARSTVRQISEVDGADWGRRVKRTKVVLPVARPQLVQNAVDEHSFAEVVNQSATMERLLDTLRWAQEALPEYHVALLDDR